MTLLLTLLAISTVQAAPFPENWRAQWQHLYGDDKSVERTPEGALRFRQISGHTWWEGGEVLRNYRVTVRLRFLTADNRYSGFSLFLRQQGGWERRSHYWVYLRPKARELYMQKVNAGPLDPEFEKLITAHRPKATPLNEWLTLKAEVNGREIKVWLDDQLCLEATDTTDFPHLRGQIGFNVGLTDMEIGEIVQENLEQVERLPVASYRYLQAPTGGDPEAKVLTDGQTGKGAAQATWRMLGPEPDIVFDLGSEKFIDRMILRAWAAPARNIASAKVLGSADGKQFEPLAEAIDEGASRVEQAHEFSFEVRKIARFVQLRLTRPVQDVSVELSEVEFLGRAPTEADRQEATAPPPYAIGPELPPVSDAAGEDDNYWYFASPRGRVAIDRRHGLVAGAWEPEGGKVVERLVDAYHYETKAMTQEADEYADKIVTARRERGVLALEVRNEQLPQLRLTKTYRLGHEGQLVKDVTVDTTDAAGDQFIVLQTAGVLNQAFRQGSVYVGGDRGLGARVFADEVVAPLRPWALGERNMHLVASLRYDRDRGVCQFRHLVNGRYARPITSSWTEAANFPPTYTPNGWKMGMGVWHLHSGRPQSMQSQLVLLAGADTDLYGFYRHLPEVEAWYAQAGDRPSWPEDLIASAMVGTPPITETNEDMLSSARRTLAMFDVGTFEILRYIQGVWGDFETEGWARGPNGERLDTEWGRQLFQQLHAMSPRLKVGLYTWAWAANPESQVMQAHPDWFIRLDKSGQVFNSYSNLRLNHARLISQPGSRDEILGRFEAIVKTFDPDFFYLDGGGGGSNLIDWEKLTLDQDPDWEDFHMAIRRITRQYGADKAVFFNARTGPVWDLAYYEGVDQRLRQSTWRESADAMATIKIRQLFDPKQKVIPLYWRTDTLPYFSNYCVGLGICPAQYFGQNEQSVRLPYMVAAYETRHLQWAEADLNPDYRRDRLTQVEAHTLRSPGAGIISVISHLPQAEEVEVSADTAKLGLDPKRPVYVWLYRMNDIREAKPAYPMPLTRKLHQETGWGLDNPARPALLDIIEKPGPRVGARYAFDPELLNMLVFTNSPAVVWSAGGRRVAIGLPEVMGVKLAGSVRNRDASVQWQSEWPEAEALLPLPEGQSVVAGEGVREIALGGRRFAVVTCASKRDQSKLQLKPAAATTTTPTITCPKQANAGAKLALTLTDADFLTVWCAGVPVYATALPAGQKACDLALPPELPAGDYQVEAISRGGKSAAATVAVAGDFAPEVISAIPPKGPAVVTEVEVHREIKGLRVLRARTMSTDATGGPWVAVADPDQLIIGGGSPGAPRTRYGYAFGGLELEGARVLDLKVENTFHDAWTLYPSRHAYHPEWDVVFTGMMADYHTPAGYRKRVALSLGMMHPYRQASRPDWGAGHKPDDFINLADAVSAGSEMTLSIDLARWAPDDWDGRVWLIAGSDTVMPDRRVLVTITGAAPTPEGRTITVGESLTQIETRRYEAVRTDQPPTLDGQLDDAVWAAAVKAEKFRRLGRMSGSTQQTYAQAAWDNESLYVAFYCEEKEKQAPTTSGDKIWGRDAVDLALDPDHDQNTFHQIIVDCAGDIGQFDQRAKTARDWPNLRHAAQVFPGGWSVEIALPWVGIGVPPPRPGEVWGVNFVRYRQPPPTQEILTWAPITGDSLLVPDKFGEIVFR
jgi:hypothetical protein